MSNYFTFSCLFLRRRRRSTSSYAGQSINANRAKARKKYSTTSACLCRPALMLVVRCRINFGESCECSLLRSIQQLSTSRECESIINLWLISVRLVSIGREKKHTHIVKKEKLLKYSFWTFINNISLSLTFYYTDFLRLFIFCVWSCCRA